MAAASLHKATIIGGEGFIGRALATYLRARGWDCHVMQRQQVWPLRDVSLGHIFYCAGLTGDFYVRAPDTVEAHAGLLARVLASSDWQSLVYLSSTRLYDDLPPGVVADESLGLTVSPLHPRHLFDLSKLLGESLCAAMGQGRARVARLASVYHGPDDVQGFLPALLRDLRAIPAGGTLQVDSSPDSERDYVHLDDVLAALETIALRGTQPIYNVASGTNTSNQELADWAAERAGRNITFTRAPLGHGAAPVSIARLHDECGWQPASTRQVVTSWLDNLAGSP